MNNFQSTLIDVLKQEERYVAEDGTLLRNAIVEDAMKMNAGLIRLLLGNAETKEHFFTDVDGISVFDKQAFTWTISNKAFLPDSYTRFKNKIGLADSDGNLISASGNVELVFPYKDCVLEGGQTKEDQKRQEIFYNELLAPDEIDRLLAPKAFMNAKRYTKEGEFLVTDAKEDSLVIKGNNLLSISSLLKNYEGRIQLIYLDPPYNTNNDSFQYNDRFNHSSWLCFMKNRLEIARKLLTPTGSIYVQLDYNEVHYCKVLMDEIFGADCFQREIIWDTQVLSGYKTMTNNWIRGHDTILFYTKNAKNFLFNKLWRPQTQEYLDSFNRVDADGRHYMIAHGSKRYRDEAEKRGRVFGDVWNDIKSFMQMPTASERVDFSTQKPEAILERIIRSSTHEGDIVLDFFAGSGTTGTVAHKLKRKYILCEQMDNQITTLINRLKSVVSGNDAGNLAKELNWKGGGSFVYCEIAKSNQKFVDAIESANDATTLAKLYQQISASGYISYRVLPKMLDEHAKEFADLSIEDQKRFLMELLDKNLLYVNACDMDDAESGLMESDKEFTRNFYAQARR